MKRQRSTAYPILSLSSAYRILRENLSAMGSLALSREDLAKRMGYQTAEGGVAARKVGSLSHYGILEREGGLYSLSPLGHRLQEMEPDDPEFFFAIRAAFENPALFANLLERFRDDGRLPDDLSVELAALGIQEGARAEAEAVFRKSALFARVIDPDGSFCEAPERVPADRSAARPPKVKEEWEDFPLLLTDKRRAHLRIPRSMRARDMALLRRALESVLESLPEYLGIEIPPEDSKPSRAQEKKGPVRLVPRET